jgi:hypothetical protein
MNGRLQTDERGISTLVSHVLALAITSILIISLIVAANTYLENQKEQVTRSGLETVGNRLAAEVSQVSRLTDRSANVTLYATHQSKIAGAPYDANIEHGSECETTAVQSENCVVVSSARFEMKTVVPIENESAIAINQTAPGRFEITALERGKRNRRTVVDPTGALVESNMRFGIGRDVESDSVGEKSDLLNIAPTNLSIKLDTSTTAAYPRAGRPLDFVIEADDVDGEIESYKINFDSKRTSDYEITDSGLSTSELKQTVSYTTQGSNPSPGYDSPGTYNISFQVTDDDGATRTFRRRINVSGLTQIALVDTPELSGYTVSLTFRNDHDQPIDINGVYLDPADDSTDTISAGTDPAINSPWELGFDNNGDGTFTQTFQAWDTHYSGVGIRRTIPDSGVFSYSRANSNFPTVFDGDTAEIQFRGLQSSGSDTYEITVTYILNGQLVTAQFESGASGGNLPPVASFSSSDPTPSTGDTVTFDATGSSDLDGSIDSYEWDLDGDGTYEQDGSSLTTVAETYSTEGDRTVRLRITDNEGATDVEQKTIDVADGDASQVVLVSGSAAIEYGNGDNDGSRVTFDLENQASTTTYIEKFRVTVPGGGPATALDTSPLNTANEACVTQNAYDWCDAEFDQEPHPLGDWGTFDTPEEMTGGEMDDVHINGFVNGGGNPVDMTGRTVKVTIGFSDGSTATYTMTPT